MEIANGLKIKQNIMSGILIKHAPLLKKTGFTNASNAHPVCQIFQKQVKTEDEQVMTTRVADIQLGDFNPRGREEWLTRVIMRDKLISYLA